MFASSFQQQQSQQLALQQSGGGGLSQLRAEDTLTELCHAAEVFVPHELNREFRLRRTFVDIGVDPQRPPSYPNLNAHQYVHARKQATRMAEAAEVPIQQCSPVEAVGFTGLKKRFDQQEEALKKQEEVMKSLVDRLNREELQYRTQMEERVRKVRQVRKRLRSTLLDLFHELDESRTITAAEQGRNFQISSYSGSARKQIGSLQEKAMTEGLKNRILQIEKKVHLFDRQKKPRLGGGVHKMVKLEEELYRMLKQVRLRLRHSYKSTAKWERDVEIMNKRNKCKK